LTPISLRSEPLSPSLAAKVAAWRAYFLSSPGQVTPSAVLPKSFLIDTNWLNSNLDKSNLKIIDLRSQPEYNTSHIPGSLALSPENIRMNRQAVGSMLQPVDMLAKHASSMGILPSDTVVLVYGEKPHDATLFAVALERLGHTKYGILNGGFKNWLNEKCPVTADLPVVTETDYPSSQTADTFTVDYKAVLQHLQNKSAIILDVRPADYFNGTKSDEARPGHIPGAINRPYTEDLQKLGETAIFKNTADLEKAYAFIIPNKDSRVIVHCRTGHQASQTLFILNKLLGYKKILWYDAGWSQWAALKDLPAETSPGPKP
jgi:thiosulfate/3-mercaptopyruvate sulfurtransferase